MLEQILAQLIVQNSKHTLPKLNWNRESEMLLMYRAGYVGWDYLWCKRTELNSTFCLHFAK